MACGTPDEESVRHGGGAATLVDTEISRSQRIVDLCSQLRARERSRKRGRERRVERGGTRNGRTDQALRRDGFGFEGWHTVEGGGGRIGGWLSNQRAVSGTVADRDHTTYYTSTHSLPLLPLSIHLWLLCVYSYALLSWQEKPTRVTPNQNIRGRLYRGGGEWFAVFVRAHRYLQVFSSARNFSLSAGKIIF